MLKNSKWLLPAAGIAALPKCPACLAVYVAIATGVGISTSTAAWIRDILQVSCVALLLFAAIAFFRRRLKRGSRILRSLPNT